MTTSGTHDLIVDTPSFQCVVSSSPYLGTGEVGNPTSSKGLYVVPAHYSWDGSWELLCNLLVEICTSKEEVVAITCLTVQEYGVGASTKDAVLDLLTSLGDYYQSLEERRERLGPPALKDLTMLRDLVRPKTNS